MFIKESKTKGADNARKLFRATENEFAGNKHFLAQTGPVYQKISNKLVDSIGTLILMELNHNLSRTLVHELSWEEIPFQTKKILKTTNTKSSILLDRLNNYYKTDQTISFINQLRNKIANSNSTIKTLFWVN